LKRIEFLILYPWLDLQKGVADWNETKVPVFSDVFRGSSIYSDYCYIKGLQFVDKYHEIIELTTIVKQVNSSIPLNEYTVSVIALEVVAFL